MLWFRPRNGEEVIVNVNVVISLAPPLQQQLDRIEKAVLAILPTMRELVALREQLRSSEESLRAAVKANTPK